MPLNGLRSQRRDWRLESGGLIEESLPHTTQRRNLRSNDGGVVDLTTEPEHAAASPYLVGAPNEANSRVAGVKRKAEEEAEHTPRPASQRSANHASSSTTTTTKRPKLTTSPPSHPPDQPIETLDLTGAAPPFPSTSHPATTTTTTTSTTQKPPRISALTCIICMEPFTNATTTSCGHIYCHECLTTALKTGERNSESGVGSCPVCRKGVSRRKAGGMVLVNYLTRGGWMAWGKGRGTGVVGLARGRAGKGRV
ncbi:hypothetical protein LTR91_006896 [Friedmanniomyces endolithicus]|uniref:RING-type domain-containing protein n=1 Tax=Friedmanniomyces endolithicus TaxID=329885 RepID=A0AAN6QWN8_9PEZI|nr:hypothetical protein LTR59_015636 [Friedmanniomyces endolithicus]KAK0801050.1 hypothetical protein LTR75_008682 [Friedmanniomyces endolithicus]KAK0994765.1 hypothetical protein LTS01_007013 [Friedmanniomyces endolithicus]KAK0996684.1 hypothetical protein LTR91_006896 [Friedmanniomyces endolithicus]KAK1038500.1 hypothetical protein LTS16_011987 [Friedmanniomyces endolithicus]